MSPGRGTRHNRRPFPTGRRSRVTRHDGRLTDVAVRAGGPLGWAVVAGGLALTSGRFGRRAALRGVVSSGLALVAVDWPGAWRETRRLRRRPLLGRLSNPPPKGGGRYPLAFAFAFAAGAGQELPVAAAPLALLAGFVGYSRVRAEGHRRSAGLVEAALGVGVGVGTRRLWPVVPHDPASEHTSLRAAEVEPSADGEGLSVVVNAFAGPGPAPVEGLRAELGAAELVEVEEGEDLEGHLRRAGDRGRAVGVSGGDGSVNTAASVAAETGKPLLVVPGGTLNHFAHAIGVNSVADAVGAVHEGRAVAVDRGLIDGKTFLNTASVGSYVELVDAREKLEGRIGKWPAVAVALWRVLRHSDPVELELDGERMTVWMIFIGNCRYEPPGFAPNWRGCLDDGLLDVRIVDGSRPLARSSLLASVLTGRLARCQAYEQRFQPRLAIRSLQGPLRLARDGETFDGSEEFIVEKAERPLVVYAPRP